MKKIGLSSLVPGKKAEHEYFSESGTLLIARGVLLTEQHLLMLKRQNILDLYIEGSDDEQIVHEVLSTDYSKHHASLSSYLDNDPVSLSPFKILPDNPPDKKPRALEMAGLKGIQAGEEGFKQLAEAKKAVALDKVILEGKPAGLPVGAALKEKFRQMAAKERDDDYRKVTVNEYNDLLFRTKTLLDTLADANRLDYMPARSIVEQIIRIMTTDMGYLLNMAIQPYRAENYIYNHSLNVCVYALCIAAASGYSQQQALEIGIGALLHDIGMLLVPRAIFLKRGKLDKDEWYEIMKHPVFGVHLLEKIDRLPEQIPFMAYQCHERENSKGYPKQRGIRFIHNYAKICAVADMYEAFTEPRPYRDAYLPYKALQLLVKASQQGLISGDVTKALVQCVSLFPVGSIVELSDHSIGKVTKAGPASPSKPVVSLLFDANGNTLSDGGVCEVNLSANQAVCIVKVLPNDYQGITWMSGF